MALPEDAAQGMSVQGKPEAADGIAKATPGRRLLIRRESDPGVPWCGSAVSVKQGLRVSRDGVCLLASSAGSSGDDVQKSAGLQVG